MVPVSGKAFTVSPLSVIFAIRCVLLDALFYSKKYFLKIRLRILIKIVRFYS